MKQEFDLLFAQVSEMQRMLNDIHSSLCDLELQYSQERYIFIAQNNSEDVNEFMVVGNKVYHHPAAHIEHIKQQLKKL